MLNPFISKNNIKDAFNAQIVGKTKGKVEHNRKKIESNLRVLILLKAQIK